MMQTQGGEARMIAFDDGPQGSGHSARQAGSVKPLTWPFVATGTLLLPRARLN